MWKINFYSDLKINTNGELGTPGSGTYCFDYTGVQDERISNDYVEILGAFTMQGSHRVPAAQFCGIYDGVEENFPGATSKYRKQKKNAHIR